MSTCHGPAVGQPKHRDKLQTLQTGKSRTYALYRGVTVLLNVCKGEEGGQGQTSPKFSRRRNLKKQLKSPSSFASKINGEMAQKIVCSSGSRGDGSAGIILENAFITQLRKYEREEILCADDFSFVRAGVLLIEAVKEYGRNVEAVRRGVDAIHSTLTECRLTKKAEERARKRSRKRRRTSSTASAESQNEDDGVLRLSPVMVKVCLSAVTYAHARITRPGKRWGM